MSKFLRFGFVCLFLVGAAIGFAQGIIPDSLTRQATFGLFNAPLDAASSVSDARRGPTFTTLPVGYCFGGLANLLRLPTGALYSGVPVTLGYYAAGEDPWSLFGSALVVTSPSGRADGVTAFTTAYEIVGVAQEPWTSDTTEDTHVGLATWQIDAAAQFLFQAGPINLGVVPMFSFETDVGGAGAGAWADANRTRVVTYYYNTALAGETPVPAEDYRVTTVSSAPDRQVMVAVDVPLYVPLGDLGLELLAGLTYDRWDQSTSLTTALTPPAAPGAVSFDNVVLEDSDSLVTTGFVANLDATLSLGPLFGTHADNRLSIGFAGSLGSDARADRVLVYREQDYTAAGDGAALVEAHTGTDPVFDEDTYTYQSMFDYDAELSARHYLYRDLGGDAVIGVAPKLSAGLGYAPPAGTYTAGLVNVTRDDGDNDGLYTSAADTVTTTTTTYYGTDDGGTFAIRAGVALPAALQFRPGQGILAITVGGEIGVDFTWSQVRDAPITSSQAISAVDGTGATVAPAVETVGAPASYQDVRSWTTWDFYAQYGLVFSFLLPEGGLVDLAVMGALPFDRVEIQASIPIE